MMDIDLFNSLTILNSRIKIEQKSERYYSFSETEMEIFIETIIKKCADIADENHKNYEKFGEALAGLTLSNTSDLIKQYYRVD